MTEAQAVEAMTQAFITGWGAAQPSVPYTLDNELGATSGEWVRFSITHTTRSQSTMGPSGARRFETRGFMFVQIFTDVNVGRKRVAELADSVRTVLDSKSISVSGEEPITTREAATRESPTDGRWSMSTVTVPFDYQSMS